MRKILIVLGPTAVGKTALSVNLAIEFHGHILSADSIQVYKGLDIISGKEKDSYGNIPVSLLDIAVPTTPFNISDYLHSLHDALAQIPSNKLPIIVGGSAYYINALLNPIKTVDIKPDEVLRVELESISVEELQDRLKKIDLDKFNSMNESDISNPRRLVRAIEVADKNHESGIKNNESILKGFDVKIIGLTADTESLDKRVDARVMQRMEQGAIEEARALFVNYDSLAPQIKIASGYKQLFEYLSGMYTLEVGIEKWKIAEHQNVRKQLTWFKKMENIEWLNISDDKYEEKAKNLISNWLNK